MSKCVVLVGGTCSGKTTLAKNLEMIGFKRVVTYTTREPREGEINGVDYHFIDREDFKQKFANDFFAEATVYEQPDGGYTFYGSAKEDYNTDHKSVIILNPQGVLSITEPAKIVWLDIDKKLLKVRALRRGDAKEKIEKRMQMDEIFFNEMRINRKAVDLHIQDVMRPEVMAAMIGQMIQEGTVNA